MLIILGLLSGLVLLFLGGDQLVKGASLLAQSIGIPPLIVGLTVVAIGTSAPELLVSISATLSGSADIAISNVVGSNIANIGLILGISSLIYPIGVHVSLLRREIPIMLLVSIVLFWMFRDANLSRLDALILLIGLITFTMFIIIVSRRDEQVMQDNLDNKPADIQRAKELVRLLVGVALLMAGAQLTVINATELARGFGVSELVIGITLVAVGTSLPELVTSVTAAFRHESDIAIGNVVGSNIFNILGILGISALIQPMNVATQIMNIDSLVMILFSVLLLPFVLDKKLSRLEGIVFLLGYMGFILYTVFSATRGTSLKKQVILSPIIMYFK